MWEVSPHVHLLWAYSGAVEGTGQVGGAGSPHPVPQGSVLSLSNSQQRRKSSGYSHKPGAGVREGLT